MDHDHDSDNSTPSNDDDGGTTPPRQVVDLHETKRGGGVDKGKKKINHHNNKKQQKQQATNNLMIAMGSGSSNAVVTVEATPPSTPGGSSVSGSSSSSRVGRNISRAMVVSPGGLRNTSQHWGEVEVYLTHYGDGPRKCVAAVAWKRNSATGLVLYQSCTFRSNPAKDAVDHTFDPARHGSQIVHTALSRLDTCPHSLMIRPRTVHTAFVHAFDRALVREKDRIVHGHLPSKLLESKPKTPAAAAAPPVVVATTTTTQTAPLATTTTNNKGKRGKKNKKVVAAAAETKTPEPTTSTIDEEDAAPIVVDDVPAADANTNTNNIKSVLSMAMSLARHKAEEVAHAHVTEWIRSRIDKARFHPLTKKKPQTYAKTNTNTNPKTKTTNLMSALAAALGSTATVNELSSLPYLLASA